MRRIKISK